MLWRERASIGDCVSAMALAIILAMRLIGSTHDSQQHRHHDKAHPCREKIPFSNRKMPSRHANAGRLIQRGLYDDLCSFTELEQRICALGDENTKIVGDAFEIFVEGYLRDPPKNAGGEPLVEACTHKIVI